MSQTEDPLQRLIARVSERTEGALDDVLPYVMDDLRDIASRQLGQSGRRHTLQATALINEFVIRMLRWSDLALNDREHFLAVAAVAMRQILCSYGRTLGARERARSRVPLPEFTRAFGDDFETVLALHDALEKFQKIDPRGVRLIEMRYFLELPVATVAGAMGMPLRTTERELAAALAWLRAEIARDS